MIRQIEIAKHVAVKGRTSAVISLKSVIINANPELHEQLQDLPRMALIERCAGLRPAGSRACSRPPSTPWARSLAAGSNSTPRSLSTRRFSLSLPGTSPPLSSLRTASELTPPRRCSSSLATTPTGCASEPAWARLLGVAPIPASSGLTTRHRGSTAADTAKPTPLYRSGRAHAVPRTKAYIARRTAEGKTIREIIRCLKRLPAREI
jgi:transposase